MSLKNITTKFKEVSLDIIRNIDANATLVVHGLNEDNPNSIFINNPFYESGLFAIELSTASNISNYVNEETIKSLHSKFKYAKDGFFYWVLLKNGAYQKNYIF